MAQEYDVVVLGGGTGGYVAAIRAAQLGLKTAIVEKSKLGGTCLHEGCIPTKALLKSAEAYRFVKKAADLGIQAGVPKFQLDVAQQRKDSVIEQLHKCVKALVKKGKIDVYYGIGRILGPSIFSPISGTISVEQQDDNEMLIPKNVIVATGAKPRAIEGVTFDSHKIYNSTTILQMKTLPKTMCIIGGGVIGIEWASMLADLEVNVTILEMGPTILPTEDQEIATEMTKQLEAKGVQILTNAKLNIETVQVADEVTLEITVDDQMQTITSEKVLVSVGRIGCIEQIGLENTAAVVRNGFIEVNEHFQTKESHIYAIGDVIGGMQLAHVAAREGVRAVEHIAGIHHEEPLDYEKIARAVYSAPEIASVGLTEKKARERFNNVKVSKFPLKAIGKALVDDHPEGFVKIVVDAETDDLLGVHMIGANATELISHSALALYLNASAWELGEVIYPHPSIAEVFGEAALAVQGKAIHY